jgi:hypothetical protein
MTNLTYVLKKVEDKKKGALCLDCLTFALEGERKIIVVRKPKNYIKKLNPN